MEVRPGVVAHHVPRILSPLPIQDIIVTWGDLEWTLPLSWALETG